MNKIKNFILLIFIFISILLTGCCASRIITEHKEVVTIDTLYKEVPVTIEIPIPIEIEKQIVPPDSVSFLQTSVAWSRAELKDGMLNHILENKKTSLKKDTVIVEKIVTVEKIITDTKIVPKKEKVIPWWTYLTFVVIGGLIILLIKK